MGSFDYEYVSRRRGDDVPRPRSASRGGSTGPRIAVYSHDTQGLGHIRRNLLISRALCRNGSTPVILLLSGLREASAFDFPRGVDCVTLPSLGKAEDGRYFPRSLDVSMPDLMKVRSGTIQAAVESFAPDVLIVDKVPGGVFGELLPSLAWLRANTRTRIVLGLREILDEVASVDREWADGNYTSVIRKHYDRIWIYGDRAVYDTAWEYGFPADLAAMTRYTGYLNPLDGRSEPCDDAVPDVRHRAQSGPPSVLCVVGGGRDGLPLAEAFLKANLPGEGALVTGPLMPAEARATLHRLAAERPDVRILDFVTDPCRLLESADRVIAMGGYNTMCEILAYRKRALIVPRTTPRKEQLIRANRFAKLGLVDMVAPDAMTPRTISAWVKGARDEMPDVGDVIDFDGVARLPHLLDELCGTDRTSQERTHAIG